MGDSDTDVFGPASGSGRGVEEDQPEGQGITWERLHPAEILCPGAKRSQHCIVSWDGITGRAADSDARPKDGAMRFLLIGGDGEPMQHSRDIAGMAWRPSRFGAGGPTAVADTTAQQRNDRNASSGSASLEAAAAANFSNASFEGILASGTGSFIDDFNADAPCRTSMMSSGFLGGLEALSGGFATPSDCAPQTPESADRIDTPQSPNSEAEAGGNERFEWEMPHGELPRRLRGCTASCLGDGVVAVFGGLRVADNEDLPEVTEAGDTTLPKKAEASGETLIFDAIKKAWLRLSYDRPGQQRGKEGVAQRAKSENLGKRAKIDLQGDGGDRWRSGKAEETRTPATSPSRATSPKLEDRSEAALGQASVPSLYVEGEFPRPRFEHSATTLLTHKRGMLVHGGRGLRVGKPLDSIYYLELMGKTLRWTRLSPGRVMAVALGEKARDHGQILQAQTRKRAFSRRAHTVCPYPGGDGRVILFGGRLDSGDDGRVCNDLMIIKVSPKEATFKILHSPVYGTPPAPRSYHSAAVMGQFMVIFGGLSRKGSSLSDVHLFHFSSNLWCKVNCPSPDSQVLVPWPAARWGHSAVVVDRPQARGGVAMLILGGRCLDAASKSSDQNSPSSGPPSMTAAPKQNTFGDEFLMSFLQPVTPWGSGAGGAPEALDDYPAAIVLSLWERLQSNLQLLHEDQLKAIQRIQSETEDLYERRIEMEQQLNQDEAVAARVVQSFHNACQREKDARRRLAEIQAQRVVEEEKVREQTEKMEARTEQLRRRLQRLQVTSEILELGRLLPPEDITTLESDVGTKVFYLRSSVPQAMKGDSPRSGNSEVDDVTFRVSGEWRGTPVTVEEVNLPMDEANVPEKRRSLHCIEPPCEEGRTPRRGSTYISRIVLQQQSVVQMTLRQLWEEVAKKELRLIGRLRHPNLIEFYGVSVSASMVRMISEPPLIPLRMELNLEQPRWELGPKVRRGLVCDIAIALDYLHSRGVAHRCVTMEHVFMRDSEEPVAKLGGLMPARLFHRVRIENGMLQAFAEERSKQPIRHSRSLTRQVKDKEQTGPTLDPRGGDVYALGIFALELMSAEVGEEKSKDRALHGLQIRKSSAAVNSIADRTLRLVVLRCMEKEPQHRMSARMVVRALRTISQGEGVVCLEAIPDDPTVYAPLVDNDLSESPSPVSGPKGRKVSEMLAPVQVSKGDAMQGSQGGPRIPITPRGHNNVPFAQT